LFLWGQSGLTRVLGFLWITDIACF
jgi:hypothetical protein